MPSLQTTLTTYRVNERNNNNNDNNNDDDDDDDDDDDNNNNSYLVEHKCSTNWRDYKSENQMLGTYTLLLIPPCMYSFLISIVSK